MADIAGAGDWSSVLPPPAAAWIDALTQLPNTPGFRQMAEHRVAALDGAASCWLLLIDIDNLRWLNGRMGHQRTDDYLRQLAAAFRASAPTSSLLGRIGGDEFAALLADESAPKARDIAESLRLAASQLWDHPRTVSVGICGWQPASEPLRETWRRADLALDSAKRLGGNRVHLYGIDG
jgi:diguanylate cyclase (GGDEF)-like protein